MDRTVIRKFKTKNFSVYLTEYNEQYTIEYKDSRKNIAKLQVEDYKIIEKANFNFDIIVDSIIAKDIEYIKNYLLYIQNNAKNYNSKGML